MKTRMIIFVDALPYNERVRLMSRLPALSSVRGMKPSFGYSVNLHYELFQGSRPDDVGFFGDANPVAGFREFRPKSYLRLFDAIRRFAPLLSRVIYKIMSRIFKMKLAFIPPSSLAGFQLNGRYLLQDHETLTIGGASYEVICYDSKLRFGARDKAVFSSALERIASPFVLAAFTEFDWTFHLNVPGSQAYEEKLEKMYSLLSELIQRRLEVFPEGEIYLVSDHGMAVNRTSLYCDLDRVVGSPFSSGVGYFYDSLYLKLWNAGNTDLYQEALRYVRDNFPGTFIESSERSAYGLTSADFGDEIFVLDEGFSFSPNFFGYRSLKCYHGYHPDNATMLGVFASNKSLPRDQYSTIEVFNVLSQG